MERSYTERELRDWFRHFGNQPDPHAPLRLARIPALPGPPGMGPPPRQRA